MSLRALLRSRREQRGLQQEDLAREMRVAQGTVSAWENGTQLPSKQLRSRLAKVLQISVKALEEEIEAASAIPRPSRVLSAQEYLRQQQRYLDSFGTAKNRVRICFVGPEHLPVLDSPEVEKIWVKNLLAGTNYLVLWFLCLVESGALKRLSPRFRSIGTTVSNNGGEHSGKILHYGLRLLERDSDSYDANEKDFKACLAARFPANEWSLSTSVLTPDLKRRLLQHYVPHGTLVAYFHQEVGFPVLASVSLRSTRTSPDAEEQPAFHFLGHQECEALYSVLAEFFAELQPDKSQNRRSR